MVGGNEDMKHISFTSLPLSQEQLMSDLGVSVLKHPVRQTLKLFLFTRMILLQNPV